MILTFYEIPDSMSIRMDPGKYLKAYPAQSVILVATRFGDVFNVAPYAWHMPVSIDPPLVAVGIRKSRDTYSNILDTGEFVVAIPDPDQIKAIRESAKALPRDQSEFETAGLTPLPSEKINTPGVNECQVNLECKLLWEKEAGDHQVVVGEVVGLSIRDDLDPSVLNRTHLDPVYHTAAPGSEYSRKGPVIEE